MTDRQLEYLVTVATEGSITKAAQKLFIGQSALSQMLSHTETELGVKLFDRSSSHMHPTPEGVLFLDSAIQILEIKRTLLSRYHEQENTTSGTLNVGMSLTRSWLFSPVIFPKYIECFPDVKLSLIEGNEEDLGRLLSSGKLDLMFTIRPYANHDFYYEKVMSERMLLILPKAKNFPINSMDIEHFELSGLKDIPFILMSEGNNLRNIAERIFHSAEISPQIIFESQNMDVCFQMSALGMGATIIPDSLFNGHKYQSLVHAYPLPTQFSRDIAIAYRKKMYLPFYMRRFIQITTSCLS